MPYELPTADQFKERFPIFDDAEDDLVERLIEEASHSVDQTWVEHDYQPAIMYLAAHLLALDNSEEGGEVSIGGVGAGGIASESFGPLSVSYGRSGSRSNASTKYPGTYGETEYGRRFYQLQRRNRAGPRVVGAPFSRGGRCV